MDTSKDRQVFVIETLLQEIKSMLRDITLRPFGYCLVRTKFENNPQVENPTISDFRGIWDHCEIGVEQNPKEPFRFWGINNNGKVTLVLVAVEQIRGSYFKPTSLSSKEISVRQLLDMVSHQKVFSLLDFAIQEHQKKYRERLAAMDQLAILSSAARYSLMGS